VKYVRRRCLQRVNLLKSVACVSWGSHPSCLILLYRGLIGSVLEYGSVCFSNMGSIPPLAERFAYLNLRYLVASFCRLGHPLREMLGVLGALNIGRGHSDVLSLDIVPSESFTRHELPALVGTPLADGYMVKKLENAQEAMYSLVAPRELLTVTSGYGLSCIFYTDDSLIEGCAGFALHQMGVGGFGYKIQRPADVFTAEHNALFTALRHITEVIRSPEKCLILTDSRSSIKAMLSRKIAHQTHPLVYECKQLCWSLCRNGLEVKLMWIPSHVGLVGHELDDERARQAALEGSIFDKPLFLSDIQSLARPALMRAW
jgi:ribonuclease HI